MIRQDLATTFENGNDSFVIISAMTLRKLMGYDQPKSFGKAIKDNGGAIVVVDIELENQNLNVIKKYTVDNEGQNQTVVEIRPAKMDMGRFLMKGEPTNVEYIGKRFEELGLPQDKLKSVLGDLMEEYKEMVKS